MSEYDGGPSDVVADAVTADEAAATEEQLAGVLDLVEEFLLDESPTYDRSQVAAAAGVTLDEAMELWHLSGFPHAQEGEVAFTSADVKALRLAHDLVEMGVLSPDRQAALVRTWGRSFARLAEWQISLLADVALEQGGAVDDVLELAGEVLPRVEALQSYIWRRHLASASARLFTLAGSGQAVPMAVGFCDIVGYTARSKRLTELELVAWIEGFESVMSELVTDTGGRVIKSLGDAVLWVCDTPRAAVDIALAALARGADPDDDFPDVRVGVAYGDVVLRLGDVFGPTVNIASRLTSLARPGSVLIDEGAADALDAGGRATDDLEVRRLRRVSVKGYSRLQPYLVRPAAAHGSTAR